ELSTYSLRIDGEHMHVDGVALIIANTGNMGITGLSMVPNVVVDDGLLDLILIQKDDAQTFMELLQTSFLKKRVRETNNLKRWKAKKIEVEVNPKQTIVWDDRIIDSQFLKIEVVPS